MTARIADPAKLLEGITPGEWWFAQEDPADVEYSYCVGEGDCLIARVRGIPKLPRAISQFLPTHAAANAVIMRAAPALAADLVEARAALRTIMDARDHWAEHGEFPPGLIDTDNQCFDDWAADLASSVLDGTAPPPADVRKLREDVAMLTRIKESETARVEMAEADVRELREALRVLLPYLPADADAVDPQQHAALMTARAVLAKGGACVTCGGPLPADRQAAGLTTCNDDGCGADDGCDGCGVAGEIDEDGYCRNCGRSRAEREGCAECQRANGPHYRGPCEHGE